MLVMRELHWAAGFLEGEGSFTAVHAGKRPDGRLRSSYNPMVHAGQVDRESLDRLQRIFGGRIYKHNMHTGNPCWRWQLAGRKGIALMMTLWSLMSERRRFQIEASIHRWKRGLSRSDAARKAWGIRRGR
jgi:hypothetical protein